MTAPSDHLQLAADFPQTTRDQWRSLVGAVLRKSGAGDDVDPELALSTDTYDGVRLAPLYTAGDVPAAVQPAGNRGAIGWDVRQRASGPTAADANTAALADLANGVTSLWVTVGDGGLPLAELGRVLEGVYLDLAPVALDAGSLTEQAAAELIALSASRGVAADELAGSLGADPIGLRARTGAPADLAVLGRLAQLAQNSPKLRLATVDGLAYHDAGGSDTDELAVSAAVAVAYLRALTEAGLTATEAAARIEFRYAVTADQFGSIAKLRAARRIWDRITELAGLADVSDRRQVQHAVTSSAMMTRRDPWVNMLRTTIACAAAAVAGADAITVEPFDFAVGEPDGFARRIARNTQSILHDESSLARVADASAGSYYLETRTEQVANAAWDKFVAIERAGGALAALDDGTIPELLAATRAARERNVAKRRDPITGVSEFAFLDEAPVIRPVAPAPHGGGVLPSIRYADSYETFRDRAEAHRTETGSRPQVFLAALGPVAAHTGRVGFATNLFAAGGLDTVVSLGSPDELAGAFVDSGSSIACLCSSDKVYADGAAAAATALRAAGARHVWVAGKAGDRVDADRAAGIDGYVYAGCDALAVLDLAFGTLGVK